MKISSIKYIVFLLLSTFFFGCKSKETHQKVFFPRKDYNLDVPIESVDAETNGKKGGETHFHSNSSDEEVFYSYDNFDSNDEAQSYFDKRTNEFRFLIRDSKLTDKNGKEVGQKTLFLSESNNYVLYWINGVKFNSVSIKSLSAVEEIEKDCNL